MDDHSTWVDKPAGSLTWQEKIHKATCMLVAMERQLSPGQRPRDLRRAVLADARIALNPAAKIKARTFDLSDSDGLGTAEPCIEAPGIIRLVLVNEVPNWRDPLIAEGIMVIIQRAIEGELGKPSPESGSAA